MVFDQPSLEFDGEEIEVAGLLDNAILEIRLERIKKERNHEEKTKKKEKA